MCYVEGIQVRRQFYKSDVMEKREGSNRMSLKYTLPSSHEVSVSMSVPFFLNHTSLKDMWWAVVSGKLSSPQFGWKSRRQFVCSEPENCGSPPWALGPKLERLLARRTACSRTVLEVARQAVDQRTRPCGWKLVQDGKAKIPTWNCWKGLEMVRPSWGQGT